VTKDRTLHLLQCGLRPEVILDKHFAPSDIGPTHKPVVPADIYRLEKAANLKGYDNKISKVDNVSILMAKPSFIGFNDGKKFSPTGLPQEVREVREVQSVNASSKPKTRLCFFESPECGGFVSLLSGENDTERYLS
ncbi:hypothetical protein TCAL_13972, partial [Tigriopus californicus]